MPLYSSTQASTVVSDAELGLFPKTANRYKRHSKVVWDHKRRTAALGCSDWTGGAREGPAETSRALCTAG